jgi:hypothetical protein
MNDAVNRYARELIEAISAAVARDLEVQACRARAKAAGFEMKVTLEALVGLADKSAPAARTRASVVPPAHLLMPASRAGELTAADRRFLRSLRIAADEAREAVE